MDMIIPRMYNGHTFFFSPDGWLNISAAASAHGKRLDHFMGKSSTWEAIEAVEDTFGERCWFLMEGQMWAHPKFSRFFAAWLGPKVEAWWAVEIDSVLNGTFTPEQAADAISATAEWLVPGEASNPHIWRNVISHCLDRILPDSQ